MTTPLAIFIAKKIIYIFHRILEMLIGVIWTVIKLKIQSNAVAMAADCVRCRRGMNSDG